MISLQTARSLLDFGARMGDGPRADEQLEGAVALHHMLETKGIAYLADEVGMGKTYVALGALALFRHFDPGFRVMVIAPRENIQAKWIKELRNFVLNNVGHPDLRVKALGGAPARGIAECHNLVELVEEATLDPDRDFFLRMTSFSFAVSGTGGRDGVSEEAGRRIRDRLRESLPWLDDRVFDLRSKQAFKDNIARAINCALPTFDLVIVDEAHNLKHGFNENTAARNRVLGLTLGRDPNDADPRLFRGYASRAKRVLLLSATPVEDSYAQLWNQLNVFGKGAAHEVLKTGPSDDKKKAHARSFLIRRVTTLPVAGASLTKNLYRREWRRGGVETHDHPIVTKDVRQRLIVALVQKKVSEVLQDTRFNASFQIGMLASFESFLETARVKRSDDDASNFDQVEQTTNEIEREGVDVDGVNRLARSYRANFGQEMPHPKMDALVVALARGWERGEKALVFVRRVASVKELKRKLDECYDRWIEGHLRRELAGMEGEIAALFDRYRKERREAIDANREQANAPDDEADAGGTDTFFAWFFRGEGPKKSLSGARVQQRIVDSGFFEDNYVADLLGCELGSVLARLGEVVGLDPSGLHAELTRRAASFLPRSPKRIDRYAAAQAAAVSLLAETAGAFQERARVVWHARFEGAQPARTASSPPDVIALLEAPTFFTELRKHPELRQRLWPEVTGSFAEAFREREVRAQLLASATRLGHSLIDLFVLYARRTGTLEAGAREERTDDGEGVDVSRIHDFLELLDRQRNVPRAERQWGAFDELADLSEHFALILDTNAPDARDGSVQGLTRELGTLLRKQQPVGGMSGQVNRTLVRQFRMPGYPLALISTDLLQEGEDLHTFCSSVHHYGISFTPSSMEQRIGRIDRVRSQTDRRLSVLQRGPEGHELLQVHFPHLEDTVEVLQVRRVLDRMNTFLRLMHDGLALPVDESPRIDTKQEFARPRREVPVIREPLRTAFPVPCELLRATGGELAVTKDAAAANVARFEALRGPLPGVEVTWEPNAPPGLLLGTARAGARQQPFTLRLQSHGSHLMIRCISPVGRVDPAEHRDELVARLTRQPARVGAVLARDEHSYDLTVEDDVLLTDPAADAKRVALLVKRVTQEADALEQELVPDTDARIDTFRKDLEREGARDGK